MADEPRRSGRATKGQHTRKDSPDPPPVKQKKTTATKKKAKEEEEDTNEVIRCVCNTEADWAYVCCDKCEAWQHMECMGLDTDLNWEKKKYYCEQCAPQNHRELLAKIANGERPWEKLFENEKKKKGSKKGSKKARKSEEPATPKPATEPPTSQPQSEEQQQQQQQPPPPTPQQQQSQSEPAAPPQKVEARNGSEEQPKSEKPKPADPASQTKRKRQSSARDSVGHDEKRRKSVPPEEQKPASDMPSDISALPPDRAKLMDTIAKLIAPELRKEVKEGTHRVPDNQTEALYCQRIVLEIDQALVRNRGALEGKTSPYFQQYHAIHFNFKNNPALVEGVLNGSISKDRLATMTSEEMAPEEKQRENAALREQVEKQAVLVHEDGPRMRKTHKGDEIIEDDQPAQAEDTGYAPPVRRTSGQDEQSPTTEASAANGSHPLKVDTSAPQPPSRAPSAGGFNIQQVWSSVGSPDHEQRRASEQLRRQSSVTVPPPSAGPGDDADVDRLLKEEDDAYSPADYSKDPSIVWNGILRMPAVADFTTVGRHVAGGDIGQIIPWTSLMSQTPEIRGRIDIKRATEYISSLRGTGNDNTNIGILSLTPVDDKSRQEMAKICEYFLTRDRWGVVSETDRKHSAVRDIYVIPVPAGSDTLPDFIQMLEYSTFELPTSQDLLLLTIIARTVTPRASAENTPAQQHQPHLPPALSTPSHPSTAHVLPPHATPHVPQFSPVVPGSAGAAQYGSPFQPPAHAGQPPSAVPNSPMPGGPGVTAQAVDILGPHISCPVAQKLLLTNPSVEILTNLRAILDEVPEARSDLVVLTNHLRSRNEGMQMA